MHLNTRIITGLLPKPMTNTLNKRLELVKNHFHLSNRRLAQVAGISGQGIADILNGVSKNPRNSIFVQISDKLDINLNWLLTGEGDMLKQVVVQEESPGYNGFTRLAFSRMGISSSSGSNDSRSESSKKKPIWYLPRLPVSIKMQK